jgi:predicted Zn-dependent peptidase
MGTGAENYQKALDGIVLQILKLKLDGPTSDEVKKARNQIWGRLMAAKLSRINQAYYLGIDEYLGREIDYDPKFLADLAAVDVQAVQRVAAIYFNDEAYVLATAGKEQGGAAGQPEMGQ